MGKNMLVNGEWRKDVDTERDEDGSFNRSETSYRDWIRDDPDARFQPAADRYHLYICRSCPWAHGTSLVRRIAGLTDVISMDMVDAHRKDEGWEFTADKPGCTPDTVNGTEYLRDVYLKADPEYTGHVTVPVLWDKQEETIVNNESIEIMQMLNDAFGDYRQRDVELYPDGLRSEIDRVIDELYEPINNGVYRAGFAETQAAYETAVTELFEAFDHWDAVLADQRYLAGDQLTMADVRMFPTLIRFDEVYHLHFKCNVKRIIDYDNLWPYLRDLYQTPGFPETVNMEHIKEGYYVSQSALNPKGIIPVGPNPDFEASHDRDRLPGEPPAALVATP